MLKILTGREGCGKTSRIMAEIAARDSSVLIVPEQYSHDAERLLCQTGGDGVSQRAEVLSFTRLANRVFSMAGGLAVQYLDQCGRLLAMRLAVSESAPALKVYNAVASRPEHLANMLTMIDELNNYGISGDILQQTAEKTEGLLSKKLNELALIYEAYEAVTKQGRADPTERLKMLAYKLCECDYAKGKGFYIDCFTDFSKLEADVIEQLIAIADDVTVCLTCDSDDIYDLQNQTIRRLVALADRHGIKSHVEKMTEREKTCPEFNKLDHGLFDYGAGGFEGECNAISVTVSPSVTAECEWAAALCRRLMQEHGARWRDISIAVSDFQVYGERISRIFQRFDVPVYLSYKADITKKPAISVICASLDVITGGFDYEDVFTFLKSGFANISSEQCDVLENYIIQWNIRGYTWKSPFTFDPQGYGAAPTEQSICQLKTINELRELAILPLTELESALINSDSCKDMVKAIYNMLLRIDLPGKLESRANELAHRQLTEEAEQCGKLWDIIVGILEQTYSMLGDKRIETAEFAKLFKIALSTGDVGTIPVYFDAVSVGDVARTRHRAAKYLLVLGANDSSLPSLPSSSGVISEDERTELMKLGVELAPAINERTQRELGVVHSCLCCPSDGLFVSYPEYSDEGGELRPSMVVQRLKALFPDIRITRSGVDDRLWSPVTAFETAFTQKSPDVLEWVKSDELLTKRYMLVSRNATKGIDDLTETAAKSLYGKTIRLSATRIDAYNSCNFSYFMQFGLKASPRKLAQFSAPEYGSFVHYILENVCHIVNDSGGFKEFNKNQLPKLVDELTENYVQSQLSGGLENKSQRFRYLFNRLLKNVRAVVDNVFDELACSDFQPLDFELAFGDGGEFDAVNVEDEAKITGKVDRVDGYVKDDKLYLRVVDYKTGKKSFDFTNIRYGISLQMLIYLFALQASGQKYYGKEIVPAGVMYMPARDDVLKVERHIENDELQNKRDKALTRSGLLLDDPDIINAMENTNGEFRFLPIKLKKGELSRDSIASAEQLGKLARFVDTTLCQLTDQLSGGKIGVNPYKYKDNTPCQYCEFAPACGHDGDSFRGLKKYTADRFWHELEGGGFDA